jgi:hypothetical protein
MEIPQQTYGGNFQIREWKNNRRAILKVKSWPFFRIEKRMESQPQSVCEEDTNTTAKFKEVKRMLSIRQDKHVSKE